MLLSPVAPGNGLRPISENTRIRLFASCMTCLWEPCRCTCSSWTSCPITVFPPSLQTFTSCSKSLIRCWGKDFIQISATFQTVSKCWTKHHLLQHAVVPKESYHPHVWSCPHRVWPLAALLMMSRSSNSGQHRPESRKPSIAWCKFHLQGCSPSHATQLHMGTNMIQTWKIHSPDVCQHLYSFDALCLSSSLNHLQFRVPSKIHWCSSIFLVLLQACKTHRIAWSPFHITHDPLQTLQRCHRWLCHLCRHVFHWKKEIWGDLLPSKANHRLMHHEKPNLQKHQEVV